MYNDVYNNVCEDILYTIITNKIMLCNKISIRISLVG